MPPLASERVKGLRPSRLVPAPSAAPAPAAIGGGQTSRWTSPDQARVEDEDEPGEASPAGPRRAADGDRRGPRDGGESATAPPAGRAGRDHDQAGTDERSGRTGRAISVTDGPGAGPPQPPSRTEKMDTTESAETNKSRTNRRTWTIRLHREEMARMSRNSPFDKAVYVFLR